MRAAEVPADSASQGLDLRRSWSWLIAVPFALVAGFVGGELVIQSLGYDVLSPQAVPLVITLLVGVPATLVMMTPGLLAYFFGMRARHEGDSRAMLPALVGGASSAFVLVSMLDGLIAGW